MMISTGLPELSSEKDLNYLRDTLVCIIVEYTEIYIEKNILLLRDTITQFVFFFLSIIFFKYYLQQKEYFFLMIVLEYTYHKFYKRSLLYTQEKNFTFFSKIL